MKKVIKVVIYARVSSEEQAKFGFSIQNQLERLNKYVEDNKLLLIDVYVDEGYSAGSTDRPELQRMLADVKNYDLIIFTKLDRFTRNVLDANEMVKLFDRNGVGIKAIDEDDVDTSTADGMFMFNLKVSLAQRELKKGSERITTVFEYKVKNGQPISGGIPFGYKIKTDENGLKSVEKDEETEHIVNEIFEYFLQYQSIRQTALFINEKYGLNMAYNTYNRILKKPFYYGSYRGNDNFCKPYITKEIFEKIQFAIKNNIRVRKNNYIYLFSGLINCPNCNRRLTGIFNKNKYDVEYYYYRCNHAKLIIDCDAKYIREDYIEDYLIQNLNRLIEEYVVSASVTLDHKPQAVIDVQEIIDEMDNLNYMFRKKRISQKDYDFDYEQLEKKLAQAQRQLPDETDLSGLQAFLNSGWKNVYKALDKTEQRALFRSIIKEINIDKDMNISIVFL